MEKGVVASILLAMLSLQALLLAAAVAGGAAGDDMGSLIRLPSDDTAALGKRPWKCCDLQPCTRSIPAICRCADQLEQCSPACKECSEVTGSDPPRYICKDLYRGKPAPMCHKQDLGNLQQIAAVFAGADEEIMAIVRGSKEGGGNGNERPWKCCDKPVMGPTTEGKVVWYCKDDVKKCTCAHCYELAGNRYYCLDGYEGTDPGPSCTTQA